jgi:hypothetical protein
MHLRQDYKIPARQCCFIKKERFHLSLFSEMDNVFFTCCSAVIDRK